MIRRVMPWRRGPDWFDEASAYVDGELSSEQVVAIERELQRSTSLRAYVEDLRAVQATLQALPEPVPRRSYILSAADAERLRPGFGRRGGAAQGAGRSGGIFASLAGGWTTMRVAATFSTVATAALVAVVLVDLTVDDGLPSQLDSRFAPTAATTEAFDQAAGTDRVDAEASAAESTVAAAPVASADADAQSRSAPTVSEEVEQASAQSEPSAPIAAAQPSDDRGSPVPESADEASPEMAVEDDGSPALAAAAPPPPASDDSAEILTPVPPGTAALEEDAVPADQEGDLPTSGADATTPTVVGTGGGLADETASDDPDADTAEPSPPADSSPPSETTPADGEAAAIAEPEASVDPLPVSGQDDAATAPAAPDDGQDDASAAETAERESPLATPAPAPSKPPDGAAPAERPTAELPAGQAQPLPAADEAAPVSEDAAAAPSRVADDSAGESAADEIDSAVDGLINDDDSGLLLALEIVFAVAAGLGLVAALWFRRRTYGRST